MTQNAQVIQDWIDTINIAGRNLSKWEEDFMESITDQFAISGSISDKQEEILERIYVNKTPN